MKRNFKKAGIGILIGLGMIIGCHKDTTSTPATKTTGSTPASENYTSMANFFARNGVTAQTYTITGSTGGSFTSPQGTVVSIPANAFINNLSQIVTGPVTITFKDIYKKSDMLLSNMPTNTPTGIPLKSGGEFYIKATAGGTALNLDRTISIKQPLNSALVDSAMRAFVRPVSDTTKWIAGDTATTQVVTFDTAGEYLYDFEYSQFYPPVDSGNWCNSDDPGYFYSYTQGSLLLEESDTASNYGTVVYLLFKGISTTDACHTYSGNDYNYSNCVPIGLQCTAVAVGVKNGTLYSSFTPITISANLTVHFSMTATTTSAFTTALEALN